MSENDSNTKTATKSFADRVLDSDIVKKGLAGAAASVIVAGILEAVWGDDDA